MLLLNAAILTVSLYVIQEAHAHHIHPNVRFYVHLPTHALSRAAAAGLLTVPVFAITLLTLWRNLYRRRWPWVITLVGLILIGSVVLQLGWSQTLTLINPRWH